MVKRVLAIDYGSKRIGLAITDPLYILAQPLPYIENKGTPHILKSLKQICAEKSVDHIIFGLPQNLDDSLGLQALRYQKIAGMLEQALKIPIEMFDERYSTKEALDILIEEMDVSRKKRREIQDSLAASLLLKSYMESHAAE